MSQLEEIQEKNPFSTIRQFARKSPPPAVEHCNLCGEAIGPRHRHLLDLSTRNLLCACRACSILFHQPAAGAKARKLIPDRYLHLCGFQITNGQWDSLRIPVGMAFFFRNSVTDSPTAMYPGPMGPTESLLTLDAWEDIEELNPILRTLEPDVEALMVNRVKEARDYFLVPIDESYRLVGLIRLNWKGLSGGREVWQELDQFFAGLKERSRPVGGANA
ncbi:MAG: DUF5947 family protein [Armatimonadota bacterium]|nr:DUF5947 family protein [Armatimonadota bacterium]